MGAPATVAEDVLIDRQVRAAQAALYLKISFWMLHPGRLASVSIRGAVAHEQRQSVSWEDQVRCAWETAASKPKPKSQLMGDSSHVLKASRWGRWFSFPRKAPPHVRDFAFENAYIFAVRFPHYHANQPYR